MENKKIGLENNFIKNAGFVDGAIQTAMNKFGLEAFKNKPFESIFAGLGTGILFSMSWPLGIAAMIGESMGYGPGYIGKLIDERIKTGEGKLDLSDASLQGASESVVDNFLQKTKNIETTSADKFLKDIYFIKKSINAPDIITALYVAKYFPIKKEAFGLRPSFLGRFWRRYFTGRGMSGLLFPLLKMFAKGIIGVSAAGGIASMISETTLTPKQENIMSKQPAATTGRSGNQTYYSNVAKNVETTLIKFLDATIDGFSKTFEQLNKATLQGSTKIQNILNKVVSMNNGASIFEINSWDAFFAPPVLEMAYYLMPQAKYEKITPKQEPRQELKKLLGEV
jgi:hypothetical protein